MSVTGVSSRLPASFLLWASGALVSQLGDAALYFALGWAATAHGGAAGGLVLSAVVLPRTLLLLFGGAAGDRWGARRIMISGDALMLLVAVLLAIVAELYGTPMPTLLGAGLVVGVVDAFYLPSSGSMPRRLVPDERLGQAVALRQTGSQVVAIIGGPIGGALVALAGFQAAAEVDAATFGVVLVVLIVIRSRIAVTEPRQTTSLISDIADGVRVVVRTPGLRGTLGLVAAAAGFIIPVGSLLVPLLARSQGWTAATAGLIIGAQSVGTIAVTVIVAGRGVGSRPAPPALIGLLLAAVGLVGLAAATTPAGAVTGALALGLGSGLFVTHLSPVLLGTAPRSHLARVQSVLTLTQSLVLLLTLNLLGDLAHTGAVSAALLCCAAVLSITSVAGFASRSVRAVHVATDAA